MRRETSGPRMVVRMEVDEWVIGAGTWTLYVNGIPRMTREAQATCQGLADALNFPLDPPASSEIGELADQIRAGYTD